MPFLLVKFVYEAGNIFPYQIYSCKIS